MLLFWRCRAVARSGYSLPRESSQVLLFEDGPFRERLEAAVCVKVMPALKQRSKYAHQVDWCVQALPALWWMAHRVVEAGQGFDLVHQFTEGIYCCVGC